MEFKLLGPVEAYHGGARFDLGRRRVERCLLGLLLLEAGQRVPAGRLGALLWDDRPPADARRTLQVHVSRIRAVVDPHRDGRYGIRVTAGGDGYLADTDPAGVDAHRFRHLVTQAETEPVPEKRARVLREALALWRGPLLADVADDRLRDRIAVDLDALRLGAVESCLRADLACGRHRQAVPELTDLVAVHPLREGLVAALMLALYRDGRQPEALEVFRRARERLAAELAAEPGGELRDLHRSILRADPGLDLPPPGPARAASRPAQLPAEPRQFTGRAAPLRELDALLTAPRAAGATVVISAIAGTAGVGKTALALYWAHRVRDRYPDGQLYANLRGYSPTPPLRAVEVLTRFLRALDVPAKRIPTDEDEAAAMYRRLLRDRRMLVLLDNAATADQVRPLVPDSPASLVVVTSRSRLDGLDVVHRLALTVLAPPEGVALLEKILGADRVGAEPEAAAELARLCAYLPLALRIAAANLRAQPRLAVADYAASLRKGHRIPQLAVDGDQQAAVRAAFDLSYAALPGPARRLFRLLGLVPGLDVTPDAGAALTAAPLDETAGLLDRLAEAHLVDQHAHGRYALHDLLRDYAAGLAEEEDREADRRAALTGLFDHYLYAAATAVDVVLPVERHRRPRIPAPTTPAPAPPDPATARAWLDGERANLVATAAHAAANGWPETTVALARTLSNYLDVGGHYGDSVTIQTHARDAGRRRGDPVAQAHALNSLGIAYWLQGARQPAIDQVEQARHLFAAAGDRAGEARSLQNLGDLYRRSGRYEAAVEHGERALDLFRELADPVGQGRVLIILGGALGRLGRYESARDCYQRAIPMHRELGDRSAEGAALLGLGHLCLRTGQPQPAADHLQRALDISRALRHRDGEANTLTGLGGAYQQLGRHRQAIDLHQQAVAIFRELGNPTGESEARNGLGAALLADGRPDAARAELTIALDLATDMDDRNQQAAAHDGLARVCRAAGDADAARRHWQRALATYAELGAPEAAQVRADLAALDG